MTSPPDLTDASDQELVSRALEGSEDAYRFLVRRHQTPVFKLIRRMVRRRDLAEELTQETFVRMLDALQDHRPDSQFSSWIRTIANHTALNHFKRVRREYAALERAPFEITPGRTVGMGNPLPAPSDSTTAKHRAREVREALDQAIHRLPENQRVCFVMHFREHRSYEDIATTLDLPRGTVGTRIHRARKRLEAALGPQFDHSPGPPSATSA